MSAHLHLVVVVPRSDAGLGNVTIYEETVRGIARVLMAETGQSMAEVWEQALSLYRVQFERDVLADEDEEE